jgi:hypothetical protein
MKSLSGPKTVKNCILMLVAIALNLTALNGQQKNSIKGNLKDRQTMQAVSFATVALQRVSDSVLITGAASSADGDFKIGPVADGSYRLIISAIGYDHETRNLVLGGDYDAGTILLQERSLALDEIVVVGDRLKAKSEADKTTFLMNRKMYDASNTGVDILKNIPGIQVDFMKNISLEGSQKIVIMVDGKERDRNFVSQLNAASIDKVEVINTPGSRYEADITGVINIILKNDRESGINGHIYAEVPTSTIYAFPDYSISYGLNKLNLYTSYNGEFSYFDIIERSVRSFRGENRTTEILSEQNVRQKNWSHRFHYGFDYFLNEKNQINFYAFNNPYSREFDGTLNIKISGENTGDKSGSALKEDTDINSSSFYSLFYSHLFKKEGRKISFDLSYFNFKAENTTAYTVNSLTDPLLSDHVNSIKPRQNSASIRIDYIHPITKRLRFDAGVKVKMQAMLDRKSEEFEYDESNLALYGTFSYSFSKYTVSTGLRAEKTTAGLTNSYRSNVFALLPDATLNYKLTSKQNLKLSYMRTIYRPNQYELNPYTSVDDSFSVQSGNPDLKQEFRQTLTLDYSKTINNSYISMQLFYKKRDDAINRYTYINNDGLFETRVANLGDISEYGIQFTGALKLHEAVTLNPYFRLFGVSTDAFELAGQYGIADRNKAAFQSGLSAIVSFKHDIAASVQFQYDSPKIDIQGEWFSDPLIFISLEKAFNKKIKAGIKSALMFTRSFTYQGTEIKGEEFFSHSEGNVRIPLFPLWFSLKYEFNSGRKLNKIDRTREDIDKMPKKGF